MNGPRRFVNAAVIAAMGLSGTMTFSQTPQKTDAPRVSARPAAPPPALPSIEKFMKIRAPNSPTLAPDGTLFVRDWPDGVNQLYKRAAGAPIDAPMTRLTDFADGHSSYSLSHDGKHIVLAAATGGNEQNNLHYLDPVTGAISPLLINPAVVYSLQVWLHDNSGFIYTANDQSPADFYIYRFDLATKQSTPLLAKPGNWNAMDVTADSKRLLVGQYISASHANAYELDADTGELTKLDVGPDETFNVPAAYLPGEHAVMVLSDAEEGIIRLFVREPDGKDGSKSPRKPLPDLDPYPIEHIVMNTERTLGCVNYNEGGYGSIRVVSLPDFKLIDMPEIEKGIIGSEDIRSNTITWALSNARNPGISYSYKLGSTDPPSPMTVADTQGINLSAFPLPELVSYSSFDGLKIPGFMFLPPGYQKGTPIPFVVNFHGGPEGQSRPGFSALTQFLLASGFGVMQPNVRGSTGYGREFHMLDNYTKRWDSVRDGVEAARWLVKSGYAQPGRIASWGGSYGGFMAIATVIEGPDVFGAAVDIVGIVNMKTFLEQTKDYRRKLREAEYGPLTDPEFLATISSIHRVDEIKVPVLIAHGLNDPRVPIGEAMQLAVGLQKRGYDPELLFFPDEGHGFAKLENRLLYAQRMVKFLQKTIAN